MSCTRCRRPFSYAVPKSDNKDQDLCVECSKHLRAGGAWETRPVKAPSIVVTSRRCALVEHVKRGCRRIHCPVCG